MVFLSQGVTGVPVVVEVRPAGLSPDGPDQVVHFLRALPISWPPMTSARAMTNIEKPMTLA